ncbi:hypothetical protein GCM10023093_28020 [Nemorincola caseinilytica]|uniref:N-acetyltransferase domain-containing protein n=1 Tax=Nemorincola caseinilytica TaxID=2054315 RepID=A0ABP8NP75_9BACT
MALREATLADIPQMQVVRNSVRENVLSDPALVPDADYVTYMTEYGKGWVYEADGHVVGFAIADLLHNNVWALFLHPAYERRGIGRRLHDAMLHWYFSQTAATIWLSTSPGTRAAAFYRTAGWQETGTYDKGEIRFEMRAEQWRERNAE